MATSSSLLRKGHSSTSANVNSSQHQQNINCLLTSSLSNMTGGTPAIGLGLQSTNATTASSSSSNSTASVSSTMQQRTIIIQKDEKGFGFKVSGSNPVEVASVSPAGAAERAGICPGQRIVKVNGTHVFNSDHSYVVQKIRDTGPYVSLTVIIPQHGVSQNTSHDNASHGSSATSGVRNLANASTNSSNLYANNGIVTQPISGLVNDASSNNPLVSSLPPSIASLSHLSQQPSAQSNLVSSASSRSSRPLSPPTTGVNSTLSSTSSLLDKNSPSSSHGNSRSGLISGPIITSPLPAPELAQIKCAKTREKTLKEWIRRETEHLSSLLAEEGSPEEIQNVRTRLSDLKKNLSVVKKRRKLLPINIFASPSSSNVPSFSGINQHMSSSTTHLLSPESMYGSSIGSSAGLGSYDEIGSSNRGGILDNSGGGGGVINPAIASSVSTAPQGPSLHSSFWSRGPHRDKYSPKESGGSSRKSHSFKDELLREPKSESILSMESDDEEADDAAADEGDEHNTNTYDTIANDHAPEVSNANILNLATSAGKMKLSESKSTRSRKKSKEILEDMEIRDIQYLVMTLLSHKNRIISSVSRSYASLGSGASGSSAVSKNPKEKITGRRKASSRASFMSSSISPEELEWLKEARKLMCLIAHSLNQTRSDINYLLFYALATLIQHELTTVTSTASSGSSASPFAAGALVKSEIKEALFELISIFLLTDSPLVLTKLPPHLSSQVQLELLTNSFSQNFVSPPSYPLHDLLTPYINFARDTVNEKLIKPFNQSKECGLLQSTLNINFSGSSAKEKKKSARESMGRLLTDALNFEAQTPSDDVNFFPESDSLVSCLKLLIQGQPLKGDQSESIPYSHSMARVLSLLSTFYHFLPHSIFFALSSAIHCELEPFILLKTLITSNPASFVNCAGHSDSSAPRHKSLPSSLGSSISATFTGSSSGVITSPTGLPPSLSSLAHSGKLDIDSNFILAPASSSSISSKQQSSQTAGSKKGKGSSSSGISVAPAGHVFCQLPFTTLCEISYCSACLHILWGKPCYLLVCSRCKLKCHHWCYAVTIQNPSNLSYCLPSDEQGIKNLSNANVLSNQTSHGHQRAQSAVIKSESSRRSFFFPDPSKIFKSNQAKSNPSFFASDGNPLNRASHENLPNSTFTYSSSDSSPYSSSSSSADGESDVDPDDDDYVSASSDPSTPSMKARNNRIKKTKRSKSLEEGVISSSLNSCPTDSDSLVDVNVNVTTKSKEYEQINEQEAKERQIAKAKIRRKLKQRKMNTFELIATERSFGEKLWLLENLFFIPIASQGIFTRDELNILFSNLSDLIKLHVLLYKGLKKLKPLLQNKRNRIDWLAIGQAIEALFSRLAPQMERDLALFCSNFIPANELLKSKAKSSKFSILMSVAESTSRLNKLKLTDLLAAPFQRIMRYPLLVTEIYNTFGPLSESSNSKFAKKEAEARVAFDSALRVIKNIVQGVNQRKSKYEFLSWFKSKISPFYAKSGELTLESLELKAEGQVTWRFNKEKSFPGYLLILPDLLLILTQETPMNQSDSNSNLSTIGSTSSSSALLPANSTLSISSTSPSITALSIASSSSSTFTFSFLSEQLQAAEASGATYVLKESPVDANDKNPLTHTTIPVLEVTTDVSTRDVASNMTAFFLFSKGAPGGQKSGPSAAMYELSTNSSDERKLLTKCINKLVESKRCAGQPSITHPSPVASTNPFLTNYQEQEQLQQQQPAPSTGTPLAHTTDPVHSIRNRPLPPLPTSASLQAVAPLSSTSSDLAQRHPSSHPSSLMRRSRSQDPGDRECIGVSEQNAVSSGPPPASAVPSLPGNSNNSPAYGVMANSQSDLPPIVGLIERVPNREPLASYRDSVNSTQPDVRYAQRVGVICNPSRDEQADHEQQLNLQIYDLLKERQLLLSRKNTSSAITYTNLDSAECLGNLTLDAFRYELLLSNNDNDNEKIELRAKLINSLSK